MAARYFFFRFLLTCLLACILQASTVCCAQQLDINGMPLEKDPNPDAGCPHFSLFEPVHGATVVSCQRGNSVEVSMPLEPDASGRAREKRIRGKYEYREYQIPQSEEDSAFDKLLDQLPMAGFRIKYSMKPSAITARNGDTWARINISGDSYNVSVVREVPGAFTPVKTAAEIARELEAHDRVDIYGIQFSPENRAIQDLQSPILEEVLKYLKQNGDLTVIVESHKFTPFGSAQSDLEITAARSSAVVAWLAAHGVSSSRLHSKPFGRTQPLAENDTPLEIAKNERIVLARAGK